MKTLKYILVPALTGILFVACNTEPKGPSQAELDSQVEVKVKAATDQLKADCDSRLMQSAQMKADSVLAIAAKKAGNKPPAPKAAPVTPKPKTVKTPPPPPTPIKVDPKKDKMSGGNATKTQNTQDKKDKMQGKEPNKEEILDKKKSKMSGK